MFDMLNTSQIVTPFNPHWSHNVAHSCDHATFSVDCCYDILQHLLFICMSTEASCMFQARNHSTSSTHRNMLRLSTTCLFCRSDNDVVL